jgi:hypothetical protein
MWIYSLKTESRTDFFPSISVSQPILISPNIRLSSGAGAIVPVVAEVVSKSPHEIKKGLRFIGHILNLGRNVLSSRQLTTRMLHYCS